MAAARAEFGAIFVRHYASFVTEPAICTPLRWHRDRAYPTGATVEVGISILQVLAGGVLNGSFVAPLLQ